ncbi:MAG: efflux RND transporter permease subunit [Polyangiaceae bacterium]|nr:efflux RND transporter permease subunit [Polyangiaceae bacterium]
MISSIIRQRATVYLAVAAMLFFGFLTYARLPREAAPDIDIPIVMVTTPYPGVSPEDVESLLTIPLETELAGLKDLKSMKSTSAEGVSLVVLEFEPEVAIDDVLQKVRDRVSTAETKLPDDAEDTQVNEISTSDFPMLILTIAGPLDDVKLKALGEALQDEIDRIPGVLDTDLSGGRTRQIRVQVDPNRLRHYRLDLDAVINAIASENVNIPGGEVRAGDTNYLIRIPGEFETAAEIERVPVARVGDRPVFVSDLAQVVDGFEDQSTYARMNGEPAVSLAIKKRAGANILDIAKEAKVVAAAHATNWPAGVTYRALGDESRFIEDTVNELESGIITSLILVVGVILFFMGLRSSLFIAVTIPLSMLLGMIVIWAIGDTLNMIVLFSLIMALGMVVDNGIVIIENIYRHHEEGKDLLTASIDGTNQVAVPVVVSTLTTVAAFVPLLFWTGIMGQFMGYLPKTIIIVLMASLVAAVFVMPVLTSRLMRLHRRRGGEVRISPAMGLYRRTLAWTIDHRYLFTAGMMAAFVGTVFAYSRFGHGTEFFPEVEPDRATITIRTPDGSDVEATDRIARQVETMIVAEQNVDVYVAEVGVASDGHFGGTQSAANQARITIDFLPHHTKARAGDVIRIENTRLTIDRLRHAVQEIPGATIDVEKERMGPPVGAPVAVEVAGDDFHDVGATASRLRRELSSIPGVTDLTDDYRVGRPEMRIEIDRGAAKRVGASTQSIASTVRTAFAGTEASKLRDGEDDYDIMVELHPRYRDDLQSVMALRIPGDSEGPGTPSVPISAVASYRLAGGSGSIRHVDQKPVVTIEGDVEEGFNENAVREAVGGYIAGHRTPLGTSLRLGGADDEQRKTQEFLGNAFLVALALIALLLVGQFNRYDLPFIILFSVVLSLVGVLWGLIITGTPFGIVMTGLGVISLAGVVVNNSIVLLDYVGKLRASGIPVREALIEAGVTRFRPVLLTAGTTVLGLVPMAIGMNIDYRKLSVTFGGTSPEWWGPMAVAIIFGLAFATVLTLVQAPTTYAIFEDVRVLAARWLSRLGLAAATPAPEAPGGE